MKNIYICHTYYHLLISIIKAMNDIENKSDLILSADRTNKFLVEDKNMIKRLMNAGIFENVFKFDFSEEQLRFETEKKFFFEPIKKLFFIKNICNNLKINFNIYNNIYIYNDTLLIGRIINMKKLNYILLEDGKDCFKNNKSRIKGKKSMRKTLKKLFLQMPDMGESKYIKYVEVNDIQDVYLPNKKLLQRNKEKLFERLSSKQKKIIWNIFIDNIKFNKQNNLTLIITQPLSEDKLVDTEIQKIQIYKDIIDSIPSSNTIILKTHPREITDYKNFFKNIIILDKPFPIEIINFCDKIKFNKVITISSTSITSIKNCKEIEILGWNWLKKYTN